MSQTFADFGTTFQEAVVQALLSDKQFAEQMTEVAEPSYFDLKYLEFLAQRYFAYAKKYKAFPSLKMLISIIKDELKEGTDTLLRDKIIEYLKRMKANPNPGDLEFAKEKSLEFCRKQALKRALMSAVDKIQEQKYESIVDDIKAAVMVGTSPQEGHDFFKDIDARFSQVQRCCVATGLGELDKKGILNGGLGRGELGVVTAGTGAGKSHFLVMLGVEAMKEKKNVLHYTFELTEEAVGLRYDSNLNSINADDILEHKQKVNEFYEENANKLGQLRIKHFPPNTATVYTLRAHIERLSLKGFIPDILIIDYADIMRSSRQYDSVRHELKLVYEELRGLAMERMICCWTASQSNREGANSDIIELTNMSEAYGKAMTADFVVGLSRKPSEKANGTGRLHIAKNRAGRDGMVYSVLIDTAQSKFAITSAEQSFEETASRDQSEAKKALLEKWQKLKSEKLVQSLEPETV